MNMRCGNYDLRLREGKVMVAAKCYSRDVVGTQGDTIIISLH
jgi:hypothetical protein